MGPGGQPEKGNGKSLIDLSHPIKMNGSDERLIRTVRKFHSIWALDFRSDGSEMLGLARFKKRSGSTMWLGLESEK